MVNNNFNPKRAVFAIPNNFTATKIKALKKSVDALNLFKEIRFIYEAEAILLYYLFSERKTKSGEKVDVIDNEKVLIFDMGGATINATLVQLNQGIQNNNTLYNIDILAKLGYGIGGDTIDYFLLKFINNKLSEVDRTQKGFLLDPKNRIKNAMKALEIKKLMIKHFYSEQNEFLLDETDFYNEFDKNQNAINKDAFKNSTDSDFYKYLKENVLINIDDIIHDIFKLANENEVNSIIMAGRSFMFPFVEQYLLESLSRHNIEFDKKRALKFHGSKLKTVVAKGACLYGVNRNAIRLSNTKTNSSFGFKHTKTAGHATYQELISLGERFNHHANSSMVDSIKPFQDQFSLDSNLVRFLQVMGYNPTKILDNDEKHKFSTLSKIPVTAKTNKIGVRVTEMDNVTCIVEETNGKKTFANTIISDDDIKVANAEHYTWMIEDTENNGK